MATDLEQRVYELIKKHYGVYLFRQPMLNLETDLDTDLQLEEEEAEDLMRDFFHTFSVDSDNFNITTYYPPDPPLTQLLNPFSKKKIPVVPDFTVGMLLESAKAGRWLYD